MNIIKSQKLQENKLEFELFLRLILNIADNHHRFKGFFEKIERIFLGIKDEIKQTLSDLELLNIFIDNRMILLFLFEKEIIPLNESVINILYCHINEFGIQYCHYFYPEIEKSLPELINSQIRKQISHELENFQDKRKEGENDSYLCSLIRNDSIKEFIILINKTNIKLNCTINPSLFETNPYLLDKNPSLIEYSAFYGSIQIFKYLINNKVTLTSSLWFYAIHSNNSELIYLLEENNVKVPSNSFEVCLLEAIKCHHNEIAEYIQDNLINNFKMNEKVLEGSILNYNYLFIPEKLDITNVFFYFCKSRNFNFVDIFMCNSKRYDDFILISNYSFFIEFFMCYFNYIPLLII